eukprot:CAMPEP_0172668100 /NCGR_PEP_ID=MMETSP1074-20121228/8853_1 /TAXON_ID=2916 /ORGANISM="Ceratium fusus, Strain PA161109" /LENGTH=166 /DNA_ID=CAMNT_0013484707 /DNA_START=247 /DNA_END=743 /DNA_ORIENTATION=-
MKKVMAYVVGTCPLVKYSIAAAEAVSKISAAFVALDTWGRTPSWSIMGPKTMPPPIPMRPAMHPARKVKQLYFLNLNQFHTMSPSTNLKLTLLFWMVLLTVLRPMHKAKPNNQTKDIAVHIQYPVEQYSNAPLVPLPPLRISMTIRTAHMRIRYPMFQYGVLASIT